MRNVKGRWKGWFFSDLVQAKYLGDLDDFVAVAGKILKGDSTIAGAQVNSEAETRAHVIGDELSLRSGETQGSISLEFDLCWRDRRQSIRIHDARKLHEFGLPALMEKSSCEGWLSGEFSDESELIG